MNAVTLRLPGVRERAKPPSNLLALTEAPRAVGELVAFYAMRPALKNLPRGDGHCVLVLPGFLASDSSTTPIRSVLAELGYEVAGWELGRNVKVDAARFEAMRDRLLELHRRTGRKVSIVGWSLGGLLARELAKMHPDAVRQVISLGSPMRHSPGCSNVSFLYEALNGKDAAVQRQGPFVDTATNPPVPCTSIFTRSDGVVAWKASVQPDGPEAENIEVLASHCGLGFNPMVVLAVADRLAQREGAWRKFRPRGIYRLLFPKFSGR